MSDGKFPPDEIGLEDAPFSMAMERIRQMEYKISELEEKLRVATDFIKSRKCKTYVGIVPPGKEVSVHSHDCPKCKALAAIKGKE